MPGDLSVKFEGFRHSIGQLYVTKSRVSVGFDAAYNNACSLNSGSILLYLGEEGKYKDIYRTDKFRSSFSFLHIQTKTIVWISQSWIDTGLISLVPCDD